MQKRYSPAVTYLVILALAGAGIYLLLSSKAGDAIRDWLLNQAAALWNALVDLAEDAWNRLQIALAGGLDGSGGSGTDPNGVTAPTYVVPRDESQMTPEQICASHGGLYAAYLDIGPIETARYTGCRCKDGSWHGTGIFPVADRLRYLARTIGA